MLVNQCSLGQFSICKANEKQSDQAIPIIQHMLVKKDIDLFIYFIVHAFSKIKRMSPLLAFIVPVDVLQLGNVVLPVVAVLHELVPVVEELLAGVLEVKLPQLSEI